MVFTMRNHPPKLRSDQIGRSPLGEFSDLQETLRRPSENPQQAPESVRNLSGSSQKSPRSFRMLQEAPRSSQEAPESSTKPQEPLRDLQEAPGSSQKAPGSSQEAPEKLSGSSQEARGDHLYIITSFGSETPDSSPLATCMLQFNKMDPAHGGG